MYGTSGGGLQLVLAWSSWAPQIFRTSAEVISAHDNYSVEFEENIQGSGVPCALSLIGAYADTASSGSFEPQILLRGERRNDVLPEAIDIKAIYQTSQNQLAGLLLSAELMDLMGYSQGGEGWVCSSSFQQAVPEGKPKVIEEGEDGEEDEEEAHNMTEEENGNEEGGAGPLDVVAIDCEMCMTSEGMALARISLVHPTRGTVLDTLVKPSASITDYLTEFSGITEEAMAAVHTSLMDVYSKLRRLISAETIIIGHSLENDLRALRLHHMKIIDTAALYPHPKGLPLKRSLKRLADEVLGKSIRAEGGVAGHDSVEDATIALELALLMASGQYSDKTIEMPHHASEIPRVSLVRRLPAEIDCSFFGCNQLEDCPIWEQHSRGSRSESKIGSALERHLKLHSSGRTGNVVAMECSSYEDAFEAAISHNLKVPRETELLKPRALQWLDMPCDFEQGQSGWRSLDALSSALQRLFHSQPPASLMMIITQGDIQQLRTLMTYKQQSKWDSSKLVPWTDDDEVALIRSAAHCLSGAVFIKQTPII